VHHSYEDILDRVSEPPTWWDCNGTPRFGEFSPDKSPNIYAREVILLEIACQGCLTRFRVELNIGPYDLVKGQDGGMEFDSFATTTPFYGDPPNTGCCPSGPTMSSYSSHIVEFWRRADWNWNRRSDLEGIQIDEIPDR